jgi:hypothetical protein
MKRKTFTDCDGKRGTVGSTVIDFTYGSPMGDNKIVKDIITKGAGGTRIYFESGGYGKSTNYKIVNV